MANFPSWMLGDTSLKLLLHWDKDISWEWNNWTLVNAPTSVRLLDDIKGYSYNGTTQSINIASFSRPTTWITLWAWINKSTTWTHCIIWWDDSTYWNAQRSFQFRTEATTWLLSIILFNASTNNFISWVSNVCDWKWHFCTATYDWTTTKVYVDWHLEKSDTALTGNIRAGTWIAIGKLSDEIADAAASFFPWKALLPMIFNRALTQTEIQEIFYSSLLSTL